LNTTALKNVVYTSKPRAIQYLRREIKKGCAAVPLATTENVFRSVARRRQQCITAGGGHFEHCDFKCENMNMSICT
jgi:hypothetical protein